MGAVYLSFRTRETPDYGRPAPVYFLALVEGILRAQGFTIDREGRVEADDWWFRATRGPWSFFVVLVLGGIEPDRWFTYVEGEDDKVLKTPDILTVVQPALERAVGAMPGVSHMRWHADHTTLQQA